VTEAGLAIAMAQAGGMGVIHKNLGIGRTGRACARVKRYESGMVVNPVTIGPEASLADALSLMERHRISGVPVVDGKDAKGAGKAGGHSHQSRRPFCSRPAPESVELMTKDRLVTVREA